MICVSVNLLFLILIKFRWFYFHLHLFQGVLTIVSIQVHTFRRLIITSSISSRMRS